MSGGQIIYYCTLVYFSIVLGILIKFYIKGVRSLPLLISTITPILIILLVMIAGIDFVREKNASFLEKLTCLFKLYHATIIGFPVLVGLTGIKLAEWQFRNNKKLKKRRSGGILGFFWPSFHHFFNSQGIDTKARLV